MPASFPFEVADCLGVQAEGCDLVVHHSPLCHARAPCCAPPGPPVRVLTVRRHATESANAAAALAAAFWAAPGVAARPRRLLVLLNPCAGRGSARRVYAQHLAPLLGVSHATADVVATTGRGHAARLGAALDPARYDAAVCVSGDGSLSELLHGLWLNPAGDAARRLPLAVLPSGSGNALAQSLAAAAGEACTPGNAALAVLCCGAPRACDVACVRQPGAAPLRSLLSLSWALIADVDVESEALRGLLGGGRFTAQALVRTARLRQYPGTLLFVQPPAAVPQGRAASPEEAAAAGATTAQQPADGCGALVSWRALDGPFVSVWALNAPWGSEATHAAPGAVLDDGCYDVVVMRTRSRGVVAAALLAMDGGGHVSHPCVCVLKATAFALDPGTPEGQPGCGRLVVDGELAAQADDAQRALPFRYAPLGVIVQRAAARLLARPPLP